VAVSAVGRRRDCDAWDIEASTEVIPETDAELGAGLGKGEESIAGVAAGIAAGAAGNFAPCDVTTNVVLRAIGVQRNFGTLEHLEQLRLVGMKPCEQAVEGDEAGFVGEDAIELDFQISLALGGGRAPVGLEITVELPYGGAEGGLSNAVLIRKGVELVNQALGMNPAQAVLADLELSRRRR
jgi:hypothetical protein